MKQPRRYYSRYWFALVGPDQVTEPGLRNLVGELDRLESVYQCALARVDGDPVPVQAVFSPVSNRALVVWRLETRWIVASTVEGVLDQFFGGDIPAEAWTVGDGTDRPGMGGAAPAEGYAERVQVVEVLPLV